MENDNLMTVEISVDGIWKAIKMKGLKEDDIFRMSDPETGKLFVGFEGYTIWKVIGSPYITEKGFYAVNAEPII